MPRHALMFLPALLLAACSSPEDLAERTGVEQGEDGPETAASGAAAGPAEAFSVSEDNALYSFDYAYPVEAAAIPELQDHLDARMERVQASLVRQAERGRADARENGFPYNPYASGTEWKVVADTPRFLSLSADTYSYSGGAHPNSGEDSLVWDRDSDRPLKPLDFFTSAAALENAVEETWCELLDQEREKRRGTPIQDTGDMFEECPDIGELTVYLGSSNGRQFNRIGLVAPPYVAGPYAEGAYEITVPVTQAVLDTVRPSLRDAFALRR